jgi:TonB-dependent receptor
MLNHSHRSCIGARKTIGENVMPKGTMFLCMLSVLLAVSFASISVIAQEAATVSGSVRDTQTGDPLPGATVHFLKTGLGASAGLDGKFIIRNVPAGSYTLRAVYVGYLPKETPVMVKEGETLRQDFRLPPVGVEGEEVLVTAQAAGQKGAINQQLSALNIVNVVSRDRIQELPDANAAESVSRLPGVSLIRTGGEGSQVVVRGLSPQYNKVTIDGVEMPSNVASANNITDDVLDEGGLEVSGSALGDRGADLSMLSSSMLGGIAVTKAITPDMDAVVIGGVVDFALRKAAMVPPGTDGDQSWLPRIELRAQGGYIKLKTSYDNYKLVGSIEKRFGDQSFGVFILGSAEKRNLSSNVLAADYSLVDKEHGDEAFPILAGLALTDVFRKRERLGGTVVLDYQHENGEIGLMNFLSSSTTQEITRGEAINPTARMLSYVAREANNELSVISNLLTVKHDFSIVRADVKLSHSYCETGNPDDMYTDFAQEGLGSDLALLTYGHPKTMASFVVHDATNAYMNSVATHKMLSKERSLTASVDLATDITWSTNISSRIKCGGMFQRRIRDYDLDITVARGIGAFGDLWQPLVRACPWLHFTNKGGPSLDNFIRDSYQYGEFLNGEYTLGYPMNVNLMLDIWRTVGRITGTTAADFLGSVINDYSGTENKSAAYAMASLDIGDQISIIPGVRYQNLTTNYTAKRGVVVPGSPAATLQGGGSDTTISRSHGYFLPMVHVRYRPLEWMQLHFAYTKTLNYPDYSTITPRYLVGFSVIDYNNHALKPATSENLDLVVSFHSNEIGLVSLNAFKKRITDLIFFSRLFTTDLSAYPDLPQGGTQLLKLNTYINNPIPIDLYGIETEWQTHFWYLPRPFNGLVLNINYTHIFSEASYPKSEVIVGYDEEGNMKRYVRDTSYTTRLLNQPNDILNLAIGYDLGGFSLRLSLLYQENIFKRPDFWMQQRVNSAKFTRWDLSVKQDLPWFGMQLFFDIRNITGENDLDVNQKNGYPASEQRYGMSADAGVLIRL